MYKIIIDNELFSADYAEETAVVDPTLTLEANAAGSFVFGVPVTHPRYNDIDMRQSLVDVYQGDDLVFSGVPVSEEVNFNNTKTVTVEGELSFLNDTIQRQNRYRNKSATQLITELLAVHNAQCDNSKTFAVGAIGPTDTGLSLVTDFENTLEYVGRLASRLNGYVRVRHNAGVRYLDLLSGSPRTSRQTIRLGRNLLDLKKDSSTTEICTVVIPRGAVIEGEQDVYGLEKRVDIKTVNNDKDYIVAASSAYFGNIWRTVTFDNITDPSDLKTAGQNYLTDAQWQNLVIEASAFDLGLARSDVEQFRILDNIRVISDFHGVDRYFMLTKLEMNLNDPGSAKITLGEENYLPLSAQAANTAADLVEAETQMSVTASNNAREILESATGGCVYFHYDANGVCDEIRIMDTNDPDTATKIWRWNINGWGYSGDGGQTYTLAATMNGEIDADFIKTGKIKSPNGVYELDMTTGTVNMANANITGGSVNINTDTLTDDVIRLSYNNYLTAMMAYAFQAKDTTYNTETLLFASGLYAYYASVMRANYSYNGVTFYDANGNQTRTLPNTGAYLRVAMAVSSSSFTAVSVPNISQYSYFILVSTRGSTTGVMASTFIPKEIAQVSVVESNCSWVMSSQNNAYHGQCYFDYANNQVYMKGSSNADSNCYLYGVY